MIKQNKLTITALITVFTIILLMQSTIPFSNTIASDKHNFDVIFVVTGQSNALGSDNPQNQRTDQHTPIENLYVYDNQIKNWKLSTPGEHPYNNNAMDFAYFAGRYLVQNYNLKVGYIKLADGGQPIAKWDKSQDGSIFNQLNNDIKHALSLTQNIYIDAVFYHQGERDSKTEYNTNYISSMERVINQFKNESYWLLDYTCFINSTLIPSNEYRELLNSELAQFSEYENGVKNVNMENWLESKHIAQDGIHFTTEGYLMLGFSYVNELKNYRSENNKNLLKRLSNIIKSTQLVY